MSAVEAGAESGEPGETPPVAGETPALRNAPDETLPTVSDDRPTPLVGEPTPSSVFSRLTPYLLIFQALTGIILVFTYRPYAATAYVDLIDLREASRLGFVRGLHFWGSHAAVIIAWLAVLQLGLRGVRRQRSGLTLALAVMLLTLALAATGHVLPWDDKAQGWITSLLRPSLLQPSLLRPSLAADGSQLPTEASDPFSLISFYVTHCFILPLATVAVIIGYRRRALRASSPPERFGQGS